MLQDVSESVSEGGLECVRSHLFGQCEFITGCIRVC